MSLRLDRNDYKAAVSEVERRIGKKVAAVRAAMENQSRGFTAAVGGSGMQWNEAGIVARVRIGDAMRSVQAIARS